MCLILFIWMSNMLDFGWIPAIFKPQGLKYFTLFSLRVLVFGCRNNVNGYHNALAGNNDTVWNGYFLCTKPVLTSKIPYIPT